jgi:transposase
MHKQLSMHEYVEPVVNPCTARWVAGACKCRRSKLRYPSDLTDDEWSLAALLIPLRQTRREQTPADVREVVNRIMYILSTNCQWAALPKDLLPRSTVNSDVLPGQPDRTLDRLHHALYVQCLEQAGRVRRLRSSTAKASGAR